MAYEVWHWRTYNVNRRLGGLMFLLVGVGFVLTGLCALLDVGPAAWAELGPGQAVMYLAVGTGCLAAGAAVCRLRTYRPDLGDVSWWAGKAGGYEPGRSRPGPPRSWWTGDPRPERRP